MRNTLTRRLCMGGILAAIYAVLTLALPVFSFGPIQIRFAEALAVLPFLLPEAVPGLAVGCFVANLLASPYATDWVVGTLSTLLAAVWTSRLHRKRLAALPSVICNAVIISAEIAWLEVGFSGIFFSMWGIHAITIAVGEALAAGILGTLLLRLWGKVRYFRALTPKDRLKYL